MAIEASVIVATFNRANYLLACLAGLAAQQTDSTLFEIVVVDNNSTDNTLGTVALFAESHPQLLLRTFKEPIQGVSLARNRGIAEAQGEFLCFLDDDAVPARTWLEKLLSGFTDPAVGVTGGPILLDYQGQTPPPWLAGDLQGLLGGYTLRYVEPTVVSKWTEFPYGGNLAFRKRVLAEVGPFRTDLGRSSDQALAGEDTELVSRAHAAGWRVLYVPSAPVRHLVPPSRLEKSYLYRIGQGLADGHVVLTHDAKPAHIARWYASDLWYATRLLTNLIAARLSHNPLWFDDYMRFWIVAHRLPTRTRRVLADRSRPPPAGSGEQEPGRPRAARTSEDIKR